MSSAKNMGRNIDKNISKNLNNRYSQKLLDHTKQSATDTHKTAPKRAIQKTAEATGHLIGNKIAGKITRIIPKQMKIKIFRDKYICPGKRQKIVDDLKLMYNNGKSKIILWNTQNVPFKFRARDLVEINDESREAYGKDNQIKFKT